MTDPEGPLGESGKGEGVRVWIPLLLAGLITGFFAWRFWFVADDAFISFRYAANWADGLGLRFNMGVDPPVEGFSNFLWTALLAVIRLAGGDMVILAPSLSLLLCFVLIVLVYRFLLSLSSDGGLGGAGGAATGIFFIALFPPFVVWSTGGLETMLFSLLLFLAYERLLGNAGCAHGVQAGAAAALMALTRPEGLIWALALAGLHGIERIRRGERILNRPLAAYLSIVLAVSGLFLAARLAYFEKLLPNTAYAKVGLSGLILQRGLYYFLSFCLTFILPGLLLLVTPLLLARAPRPAVRHAAAVIVGFVAFAVFSGGDFMAMSRFLAPAAPFFAVLFVAALETLRERIQVSRATLWLLAAVFLVVQVLPAFDLELMPAAIRRAVHFRWNDSEIRSEYGQWQYMRDNGRKWRAVGKALALHAAPGDSILCSNIGAIGYYSGLFIYDECGLIDPKVASRVLPPDSPRLSAGHDKMLPSGFFLRFEPTYFLALVVKDHEVQLFIDRFVEKGLPPGYGFTTLPLEGIEGAPERSTLVLIERERGT